MITSFGIAIHQLRWTFPESLDLHGNALFNEVLKDGLGFPTLTNTPWFGLCRIILVAGHVEGVAKPSSEYTGGPQDILGGFDGAPPFIPGKYPFATQIEDPEERDRKLNIEIQNGRAAMLGVTGAMMHSCLDSTQHHFFYPITHN